jgi:GNAT superfamily N-acetyltransferase
VSRPPSVFVRPTQPEDFDAIIEVCQRVYPHSPPWRKEQLASHLRVFPEGQFVAVERETARVLGMAASLVIAWADYEMHGNWREFTDAGMFTNHDLTGKTLYGAEVLVRPSIQRRGVGSKLYEARFALTRRLGLRRIRAAARLRGYGRYAKHMSAVDYVVKIVHGELKDPTLSFQMRHGFDVLAVVSDYLMHDQESGNYAAVIEWLNPEVTTEEDSRGRDPRFKRPGGPPPPAGPRRRRPGSEPPHR